MGFKRKELKEYAERIQREFAEVQFNVTKRLGVWELIPTTAAYESYLITLGKAALVFTITADGNTRAISTVLCHNIEELISAIQTFYKHGAKLHDEIDSRFNFVVSEVNYRPYSTSNDEGCMTAEWNWGDIQVTFNTLPETYILSVVDKRQEFPLGMTIYDVDSNHIINLINFFNEYAEVRIRVNGTNI